MKILNQVSVFQNYQKTSDVIAERPKLATEIIKPIKQLNEVIVVQLLHDYGHEGKKASEFIIKSSNTLIDLFCSFSVSKKTKKIQKFLQKN